MSWSVLVIAAIMLYLVNKYFDLKNLINPFVFFYIYQTAFCFIALSYCEIRFPRIPVAPDLRNFIILSYVLTFVGAMLSRYLFSVAGIRYVRMNDIKLENRPSKSFQISGLLIYFIGIFIFIIFTFKTGGIILFADDIENERITRKAGAGLYNLLFLAFMLYGYIVILLMKDSSKVLKTALFLLTAFALMSYGSRAPLLKLFIATFLMVSVMRSKKITLKKYFKIAVILFIFLVAFGAIRSNFDNPEVSFLRLMQFRASWRPFVNIQNLQKIYDFFPDQNNFLYGYSYIIDMKLFLPGSNPNFGTYLKDVMNWDFDGGSVTTTFIGLGYLNFGKLAFIIYPLIYGFILNTFYQLIINKDRVKNTSLIFIIFFSIGVSGSVSTGLFGTLINNILFLVVAVITHLLLRQLMQKKPMQFKLE